MAAMERQEANIMNKRFLSVLAFALLVSAVASVVVYRLIASRLVASAKPADTQIIAASRDLPMGTLIRDLDVSLVGWTGTAPKGAFTKREEIVGRGVLSPIYAGEPVLENRLAAKGAGAGLAANIRPGMRAVALRVNEVVGVAGFVIPGMRVDVLIAGTPPNARNSDSGTQTRTILQNIEVLSAGQNIQKDAEGKPVTVPVVNLLVTPEQAEILSLASNETKVQLVLRNPLDTEETKPPGTALARLFGAPAAQHVVTGPAPARRSIPRPAPAPPAVPVVQPQRIVIPITVEVLHGTKQGVKKIETSFKEEIATKKPAEEASAR
jgi:pilus assembly protein CpaB